MPDSDEGTPMTDERPTITLEGTWQEECVAAGVDPDATMASALEFRRVIQEHYATIDMDEPQREAATAADLLLLGIKLARQGSALDLPGEQQQDKPPDLMAALKASLGALVGHRGSIWITDVGALRRALVPLPSTTPLLVDLFGAVRFDHETPRRALVKLTNRGLEIRAGGSLPTTHPGEGN